MDPVQKILDDVTRKLEGLPGVVGVVLGGPGKGTHRPDSDIDIGIYYDESKGVEVRSVGEIATELDDEHRTDLITPWGHGDLGSMAAVGSSSVDITWTFCFAT